jgi:hypothetical protein
MHDVMKHLLPQQGVGTQKIKLVRDNPDKAIQMDKKQINENTKLHLFAVIPNKTIIMENQGMASNNKYRTAVATL